MDVTDLCIAQIGRLVEERIFTVLLNNLNSLFNAHCFSLHGYLSLHGKNGHRIQEHKHNYACQKTPVTDAKT